MARGAAVGIVATVVCCALVMPAAASAYKIDRNVVPQPVLRYYVGLPDWKRPFARVVKALNRAHVGVRLVRAKIPQQASIQIGRLEHRCGYPGINGTTQTIQGGYAAIYLPRGCRAVNGSVIAAHELGHALGLKHEDRRCALMNSSGSGRNGIPTRCQGRRYNWVRKPFRADDLAGLRKAYRNTPPVAGLSVGAGPFRAGETVRFTLTARDRERNLSELVLDFGDGDRVEGFEADQLPRTHVFDEPGTYTVTLSLVDYFGRRARASVEVEVLADT
jgi:hypothetical protein